MPLPSATDSARLAKMTVIQSQIAMLMVKAGVPEVGAVNGSVMAISVVSAAPTSTTNMTGLRHISLGSSLRRAPGKAAISWPKENALARLGASGCADVDSVVVMVMSFSFMEVSAALPPGGPARGRGNT